jgi:hypothetical protein
MKEKKPGPTLKVVAAGNINQPYTSLGVVHATVAREETGCSGGLPVGPALREATNLLIQQAYDVGGDGLIHISYMHRVSSSQGCAGAKANFEVYAWGTAITINPSFN